MGTGGDAGARAVLFGWVRLDFCAYVCVRAGAVGLLYPRNWSGYETSESLLNDVWLIKTA